METVNCGRTVIETSVEKTRKHENGLTIGVRRVRRITESGIIIKREDDIILDKGVDLSQEGKWEVVGLIDRDMLKLDFSNIVERIKEYVGEMQSIGFVTAIKTMEYDDDSAKASVPQPG